MSNKRDMQKVKEIIQDAGGTLTGRTRLQKTAYLLEITGLGEEFGFGYKHYGPYSERLSLAVSEANATKLICEEEKVAAWGGSYSVFSIPETNIQLKTENPLREKLIQAAKSANAVDLELAATAAFLSVEGEADPWAETERRKPLKAESRLQEAKILYQQLREITFSAKNPLPDIKN